MPGSLIVAIESAQLAIALGASIAVNVALLIALAVRR
jgi:hypothetical protein